jgi:hypothetical protein
LTSIVGRAKDLPMHPNRGILVATALLIAACVPGGISRDRALELALAAGSDSVVPARVVSAEAGPLGRFVEVRTLPDERRDRQVWAVLLAGDFEGECVLDPNGDSVCPRGAAGKLIVLDHATGEFLLSESR